VVCVVSQGVCVVCMTCSTVCVVCSRVWGVGEANIYAGVNYMYREPALSARVRQ